MTRWGWAGLVLWPWMAIAGDEERAVIGRGRPVCEAQGYEAQAVFVTGGADLMLICYLWGDAAQGEVGPTALLASGHHASTPEGWTLPTEFHRGTAHFIDRITLGRAVDGSARHSVPEAMSLPVGSRLYLVDGSTVQGPTDLADELVPLAAPFTWSGIPVSQWTRADGETCAVAVRARAREEWVPTYFTHSIVARCGDAAVERVVAAKDISLQAVIDSGDAVVLFFALTEEARGEARQEMAVLRDGAWTRYRLDHEFDTVFRTGDGEVWAIGGVAQAWPGWQPRLVDPILYSIDLRTGAATEVTRWTADAVEVAPATDSGRVYVASTTGRWLELAEVGAGGIDVLARRRLVAPMQRGLALFESFLFPGWRELRPRSRIFLVDSAAFSPSGGLCVAVTAFTSGHSVPAWYRRRFGGRAWVSCVDVPAPQP